VDRIDQMFDLLDVWRHLPAYQLERRADILFALYLPAFLTNHLGIEIRPEMIPEFPVRLGSIDPDATQKNRNLSCKIDYVALAADASKVYFIELKTDGLMRRQRQDDYLLQAQKAGMPVLVDGVCSLFFKSSAKNKYRHLLALIESLGLMRLPPAFFDGRSSGRGREKEFPPGTVFQKWPEISIVYLQPRETGPGEIGFERFADWIGQFDDPLSKKFVVSLRSWARSPAGTGAGKS
jgi:hypothetical protein